MQRLKATSPNEENATLDYCHAVDGECRKIDQDKILLKSKNMSDLHKIQEIMIAMEEKTYTIEQVLERIIGFYGRFVAFS